MWLIVGLGNPGIQYQEHRHNIGFQVIRALAEKEGQTSFSAKFQGFCSLISIETTTVLLLLPQTYMNLSGESVLSACQTYNILPENILVVHDELDLVFSRLQLKRGGGEGGHNGLRSISFELSTKEYNRLRFGVGKPPIGMDVANYVLSPFFPSEKEQLDGLIEKSVEILRSCVRDGVQKAMSDWNQKNPTKNKKEQENQLEVSKDRTE